MRDVCQFSMSIRDISSLHCFVFMRLLAGAPAFGKTSVYMESPTQRLGTVRKLCSKRFKKREFSMMLLSFWVNGDE